MTEKRKRKLARLAERPYVPASQSPFDELRLLVRQHRAITKASVAIANMSTDKVNRETGETIPCRLPEDVQLDLRDTAKRQRLRAKKLESSMLKQLRQIPIYDFFLKEVYGCGPVVAAYLCAEVDIRKAVKPSNLRRFCGLAVINGRLERHVRGERAAYSQEMRTRLWQMAMAMYKNGAHYDTTSKYLRVWHDWIHRVETAGGFERATAIDETKVSERADGLNVTKVVERADPLEGTEPRERARTRDEAMSLERAVRREETIPTERAIPFEETEQEERATYWEETKGTERAESAEATKSTERRRPRKVDGWARAIDVFLTDLYVVWRTLEGLPVWPSYLAGVVRGFEHKTGEPVANVPRVMSVADALEFVGYVGGDPIPKAAE